jgi:hypothetical protein
MHSPWSSIKKMQQNFTNINHLKHFILTVQLEEFVNAGHKRKRAAAVTKMD